MAENTCAFDGCERIQHARGLCGAHYLQLQKYGTFKPIRQRIQGTSEERFLQRVTKLPSGCWEWDAGRNGDGYGNFYDPVSRSTVGAHRWAYLHFIGPADGLQIDHLCFNRGCVNPEHLEAVSCRDNLHRGNTNANKTSCIRGHEFTPENTRMYRGKRSCRICTRLAMREYRAAKRRKS